MAALVAACSISLGDRLWPSLPETTSKVVSSSLKVTEALTGALEPGGKILAMYSSILIEELVETTLTELLEVNGAVKRFMIEALGDRAALAVAAASTLTPSSLRLAWRLTAPEIDTLAALALEDTNLAISL